MEYFLKCYLEQLENLPRNLLHDRRKRRSMVEYISTLIEGCRRGENCDIQKTVREAIISIIRYHESNLDKNGSVCKMGKYHNILYIALKLCFDYQLNDTSTIIVLLENIYLCEKTFERLLIGAIFGNKAPHFISGWKSDFYDQEENFRAMIYFIDHATNGNLEFNQIRFIDIPIECCGNATPLKIIVQLGLPDKLHIMLRYGALIDDPFDENTNLIEYLLQRLSEFFHCYPYNIVACLQLILRVVPRIIINPDDYCCIKDKILNNYMDLIDDCIVPLNRCGIEVPELKHLARCRIRQQLWTNYQLPNGIHSLPIPDRLRRYIDIMED